MAKHWRRRVSGLVLAALLLSILLAKAEVQMPASAKPNFLVIVVDDQGYADLGAFGHHARDVHTPNMDRIAARGVLFTQAYTTAPVCSPSRAGWNTGLYQQRWDPESGWAPGMPGRIRNIARIMKSHGYATARFGKNDYGKGYHVQNTPEYPLNQGYNEFLGFSAHGHDYFLLSEDIEERTPDPLGHSEGYKSFDEGYTTDYINPWVNNRFIDNEQYPLEFCQHTPPDWNWEGLGSGDITLPSMLQQAGYTTIHVGKAHFAPFEHEGEDPLNLGFEVNVAGAAIGAPGSYYGEQGYGIDSKNPLARPVPGLDKYHGTGTFLTEALTLEAKAELDKALTKDKPFFLYMSHYAVHSPFNSDPRFADHYKDPDRSKNVQAYATLIEGMDKSLGDLMDHLEAKGVADHTLIFLLGDNGGDCPSGGYNEISSSAPLRGRKGSRWEGGVRVPFIAAWAKLNPENRRQKKIPIVAGSIREEVGSCYDLENDPDESLDLASENTEKLRSMMQAMVRELESMNAQYPFDGQGREVKPVIP
jgi:arylsulfatase A-like enzyme